jgi:uncharacterized membrane protein
MWIAFLPFPTSVFSEPGRGQMPLVLYAASLGFAGISSAWLWRYAVHHGLVATGTQRETIKYLTLRAVTIPFVCLIAIGISFLNPILARWSFCLIPFVQRIAIRLGARRRFYGRLGGQRFATAHNLGDVIGEAVPEGPFHRCAA